MFKYNLTRLSAVPIGSPFLCRSRIGRSLPFRARVDHQASYAFSSASPGDRVAIVTGGNSGMGAATVKLLQDKGFKVASLDWSPSSAEATNTFLPLQCNVASEQDVTNTVGAVVEKWGTVNILVNNAGVIDDMNPVEAQTEEVWHRTMGVNLHGPYHLTRACIPHMLSNSGAEKGAIVNISSLAARHGGISGSAYTASKHGLLGLTRSTAWMYRDAGIRCNAILPGMVLTNIGNSAKMSFDPRDPTQKHPLASYAGINPGAVKVEDIAATVYFLATTEGINGAHISVDKGWDAA